jgi:hypothetical protein
MHPQHEHAASPEASLRAGLGPELLFRILAFPPGSDRCRHSHVATAEETVTARMKTATWFPVAITHFPPRMSRNRLPSWPAGTRLTRASDLKWNASPDRKHAPGSTMPCAAVVRVESRQRQALGGVSVALSVTQYLLVGPPGGPLHPGRQPSTTTASPVWVISPSRSRRSWRAATKVPSGWQKRLSRGPWDLRWGPPRSA